MVSTDKEVFAKFGRGGTCSSRGNAPTKTGG